jgi:hypothetical protein
VRVFLSSTYQDLVAERDAVYERLRYEYDVVRMEDFGSRDEVAIETCLAEVETSDAYVLLLGHRYGTRHPEYNLSYTQIEYERARQCRLPVLPYFRAGLDDAIADADDPIRLRDFAAEVGQSHSLRKPDFATPEELAEQVYQDLRALQGRLQRRPVFGRSRAAIEDTRSYAAGTVRFSRLQLSPIVVVLADTSVLSAKKYPEGRGRRMRDKINEIVDYLRSTGANALIFNDIPATKPTDVIDQRISEVRDKADVVVCIVRGEADAPELGRVIEGDARFAVWYPDRLSIDVPADVRHETYTPEELQQCGLALDIERYLDAVIDEHVAGSLA